MIRPLLWIALAFALALLATVILADARWAGWAALLVISTGQAIGARRDSVVDHLAAVLAGVGIGISAIGLLGWL